MKLNAIKQPSRDSISADKREGSVGFIWARDFQKPLDYTGRNFERKDKIASELADTF